MNLTRQMLVDAVEALREVPQKPPFEVMGEREFEARKQLGEVVEHDGDWWDMRYGFPIRVFVELKMPL